MQKTAEYLYDVVIYISGFFHEAPGYRIVRRRGTPDWLVTFTVGGRGIYRQPGVELYAEPGDLILLEPGASHDYGCTDEGSWEFVWAHFVPRQHWIPWLELPAVGRGLRRVHVADSRTVSRLHGAFLRCHRYASAGNVGLDEELALNGLEEVLLLAGREQSLAAGEPRLSPEVRRAVEHLAEQLAVPQTIAGLAGLAGLSRSRFAHRFKAETGDSPIAYLTKLRLRQAARLLEHRGRRVGEAARDVGFDSPFYFSRQFKKQYGVSPREYQRRTA